MKKAFTLIELLVVISIIGLLATVAVISLTQARVRSRDAKRLADMRQVQAALEQYNGDYTGYPSVAAVTTLGAGTAKAICNTPSAPAGTGLKAACGIAPEQTYIGLIPIDPTNTGSLVYAYTSYATSAKVAASCMAGYACGWYEIAFQLEGTVGNLTAGAHAVDPNGIR